MRRGKVKNKEKYKVLDLPGEFSRSRACLDPLETQCDQKSCLRFCFMFKIA